MALKELLEMCLPVLHALPDPLLRCAQCDHLVPA